MAIEKSPYEGTFDSLNGRTALGRIVDVDVTNRRCRVKTIGSQGPKLVSGRGTGMGTDDQDIHDVQWITTTANDGGAEDTSVPSIGQIGVLLYINSEPYIIGYFRTLPQAPQDVTAGDEDTDPLDALVTQGDRLLKTVGGNSVTLRSGGSIEIVSTQLCRTYWLPSGLLTSVCGNYELTTDGGFMEWTRDTVTNDTLLEWFVQDNLEPTNGIDLQMGTTEGGFNLELSVGPVDPDTFALASKLFSFTVGTDGTPTLTVGNNKAVITIDPATGNISMTTQGNLTQTVQGDLTQTVSGTANIDVTGAATLSADTITLDGTGENGEGAEGQLLVYPEALSDFTGAPIAPPSNTLKGSL